MNKFKIGDMVRLKTDIGSSTRFSVHKIGHIGKITELEKSCDNGSFRYRLGEGIGNWADEDDLELTNKATSEGQTAHLQHEKFEVQMQKIGRLYTKEQVDKLIKEKEEELKSKYNKAIFNLSDALKAKSNLLNGADEQLEKMAVMITKKDETIRELAELIIRLTETKKIL